MAPQDKLAPIEIEPLSYSPMSGFFLKHHRNEKSYQQLNFEKVLPLSKRINLIIDWCFLNTLSILHFLTLL